MEHKYYDQFKFGYSGKRAKQGYVWLEPGVPIVPVTVKYEKGVSQTDFPLFLTGKESLTEERFLCESPNQTGYDAYLLNTSGNSDKETRDEEPALCYIFADTKESEKGFKQFVDKWGLLESRTKLAPPGLNNSDTPQAFLGFHDAFDKWVSAMSWSDLLEAHKNLRFASVLWRLLDAGNHTRIREIFQFDTLDGSKGLICHFRDSAELKRGSSEEYDGIWEDYSDDENSSLVFDVKWGETWGKKLIISENSEAYHFVESGDVIAAAMWVLQLMINGNIPERLKTSAVLRKDAHGVILSTRPTSLLGALWLQLFLAVCGERTLRRCEICGEWDLKSNLRSGRYHRKCYSKKWMKRKREEEKQEG